MSPLSDGSAKLIFTFESAFETSPLMSPEACWNESLSMSPESLPSVPQRSCCFARTQTSLISARGLFWMYCLHTVQIAPYGHVGHAMAAFASIVMLSDSTPKRGPMIAPIATLL